jgi:hypothetical protein
MIILWILLALILLPLVLRIGVQMWTLENLVGLIVLFLMFYGLMWLKYGWA